MLFLLMEIIFRWIYDTYSQGRSINYTTQQLNYSSYTLIVFFEFIIKYRTQFIVVYIHNYFINLRSSLIRSVDYDHMYKN